MKIIIMILPWQDLNIYYENHELVISKASELLHQTRRPVWGEGGLSK